MHSIQAHFDRFEDLSFYDVLNGTGVYVIWDSQAKAVPSYLGQGDLLSRLSKHADDYAFPVRGYVSVHGYDRSAATRNEAIIVEALLLEVAAHTDRWPKHNARVGHIEKVAKFAELNSLIRMSVTGCDPFAPPNHPRHINGSKRIAYSTGIEDSIEYDWSSRKKLRL